MGKKHTAVSRFAAPFVAFIAGSAIAVGAIELSRPDSVGAADSTDQGVMQSHIDVAKGATLRIVARGCSSQVTGSAFALATAENGEPVLITNKHIVTDAAEAKLDAPVKPTISPVLASSEVLDLAAVGPVGSIALEPSNVVPSIDDPIVVIGHPGGHGVVAIETTVQLIADGAAWGHDGQVLLFEAALAPGFSGGPVIDRAGDVVGVVSGYSESTGLGVALLASDVVVWLTADNAESYKIPPQVPAKCAD